jgi:hypothetical protein
MDVTGIHLSGHNQILSTSYDCSVSFWICVNLEEGKVEDKGEWKDGESRKKKMSKKRRGKEEE